jgi:hypothetical protein
MRLLIAFAAALLSCPAATYYVTIAGLGGEPEYEQRFGGWAKDIDKVVKEAGAEARGFTLMGSDATKARLQATLQRIAGEAKKDDALVVTIIGHGTFDGTEYKMNLPGPDMTAIELATLLDRIPTARQLVVNMTSASGASLASLRKKERAVITATKSGNEKNATVFARFWVEAMRDPAADADKNEVISALEAFRYAEQKTVKFYESQNRLATEHALLEDTGTGDGARLPSAQNGQGLVASRFPLLRIGAAQAAYRDPAKLALLQRKENLEQQIDQLKYQKAAIPAQEYRSKIQALLTELAKVQAELDK